MKKRLALTLATAMVATSILAACSKPSENNNSGNNTENPPKASDVQELTMNLGSEPPNLDSGKTTDSTSFDVLNNTMEGLIRLGEGFKILPGIAEKWEISPDGLTYTFTLRKDAKWSDGKPVTSKDFKFAWLRALDPNTASDYGYQLHYIKGGAEFNGLSLTDANFQADYDRLKQQVAIETPDDHTLKATLVAPTPYWLGLMAFPTYLPVREDLVQQHGEQYAAEADKLVFNGPFKISEWVHEDHITLVKNPDYWDAGAVKLEKITFRMITDTNTAIQMYETGELDRVGVPGEFIAKYSADPGFRSMANVATSYVSINVQKKELANVNIRKALNLAINRKGFVDNVLKNGSIPAEGYVPSSMAAGSTGKKFREISGSLINVNGDPAKAKEHWEQGLKELGITQLNLTMIVQDTTNTRRVMQGLQEMWNSTLPGLHVELEPVTWKVLLDRARAGDFELLNTGWIGDFNDPMTFMNMFITDGSYNDPGWSNKEHDALIKTAETSSDDAVRMDAMAKAEKIMMEELPILPLFHAASNWVSRPYLKGVLDFPLGGSLDLKSAYIEGKAK